MLSPQHAQHNEGGDAQEPLDDQHNPDEQQQGSPTGNDSGSTSNSTSDIMDGDTEKPQEAIGIDYKAKNQQSLTQVIKPNTRTSI